MLLITDSYNMKAFMLEGSNFRYFFIESLELFDVVGIAEEESFQCLPSPI